MNGFRYHRLALGLSQDEVARRAGVKASAVNLAENAAHRKTVAFYLAMRAVLGASIAELLRNDYPDDAFGTQRVAKLPKAGGPSNPIAVYRRTHRLTLDTLGGMLGVTRQRVSVICAGDIAPCKHIETLAASEGITAAEFVARYSEGGI